MNVYNYTPHKKKKNNLSIYACDWCNCMCLCARARTRAHVQINILIIGMYLPYVYHSIFKYVMKLVQENIM